MSQRNNPAPHLLEQYRIATLNSPLAAFRRNVYSQSGEDGVIERIFQLIPPVNRYCVEFGAWDGKHLSNCAHLIDQGWSGLLVEPNPDKYQELVKNRGQNSKVTCLRKFISYEGDDTLDNTLKSVGAPLPDLISIDVDGHDYFIWEALTDFQPPIVLIEFNPSVPNDVAFVQPKVASIHQGCSLLALILLGKRKGYELAVCTSANAFFVRKDLFPALGVTDNGIYSLYQPKTDGRIFHCFDSFVYVVGMPRLIWSTTTIEFDTFQVDRSP